MKTKEISKDLRKKIRQRLTGTIVLVSLGILILSALLHTTPQPRPYGYLPFASIEDNRLDPILLEQPQAITTDSYQTNGLPLDIQEQWIVHLGSFQNETSIKRVRQVVADIGLATYTQNISTTKGDFTRVRVGPIASNTKARAILEQVKSAGIRGAVIQSFEE
jgi:DedD protein